MEPETVEAQAVESQTMEHGPRLAMSIYVDRTRQQWVVRDREGNLWMLPSSENSWEERQPFVPTEETELEPVPGHYKTVLGLPY